MRWPCCTCNPVESDIGLCDWCEARAAHALEVDKAVDVILKKSSDMYHCPYADDRKRYHAEFIEGVNHLSELAKQGPGGA